MVAPLILRIWSPLTKPGLGRRGVLHRGNDDEHAVLRRDDQPQAVIAAAGVVLHVLEAVRLHELAVRIEPGEHAAQGVVGERAEVGLVLVHVILPDELEDAGEDRQAAVDAVVLGGVGGEAGRGEFGSVEAGGRRRVFQPLRAKGQDRREAEKRQQERRTEAQGRIHAGREPSMGARG